MTTSGNFYDPNTPVSSESFAQWQENFIQNFTVLDQAFSKNHVSLETPSISGNHTIIQLLEQQSSKQTGASELSVYTKDVPGQTDQVFIKLNNQTEFQFTNYQIHELITPNTYFTFLPGGLIVYFGLFNYATAEGKGSFKDLKLLPAISKNIISANFTQAVPNTIATQGGVQGFSPVTKTDTKIITALTLYATFNVYYTVVCNT